MLGMKKILSLKNIIIFVLLLTSVGIITFLSLKLVNMNDSNSKLNKQVEKLNTKIIKLEWNK